MSMGVVGFTAHPFALLTWTAPEDNYGGAVISVKLHSDAISAFRVVGTYTGSTARIEGLVPGQLYDFLIESLNVTGELKGLGVTVNNSGAGYIAGGDNTAPATPTGLDGEAKHGKLVWTWNKNAESDVSHYIIEIYTATSGGSLLKRDIVPHENNASFTPGYEYQRQTGDLTSSLVGALRVAAVDHSGNTSGFTSRFGLSTGALARNDAVKDDFNKQWQVSNGSVALGSGDVSIQVSVSALSGDTFVIDASFVVRVTSATVGPKLHVGYAVWRNSSLISVGGNTASTVTSDITRGTAATSVHDSPGAGTHVYKLEVFGALPGSWTANAENMSLTVNEYRR